MIVIMPTNLPEKSGEALKGATEAAKAFLGKLLGPAVEEAGLMLRDEVRFRRFKRDVKILNEAEKFLQTKGVHPTQVPQKILVPLLESGSLEEDDSMVARWAALLASAADPELSAGVQPSFPEILKQLSSLEANALDLIFEMVKGISPNQWSTRGAVGEALRESLKVDKQRFEVAIDNLYRLRLCLPPSVGLDFLDNKAHRFQLSTKDLICITDLGYAFVSACKIPGGTSENSVEAQDMPGTAGLAREAMGAKFRGQYDPRVDNYAAQDIVVYPPDGSPGALTFVAVRKVPAGISPATGHPYWEALPNASPGTWL